MGTPSPVSSVHRRNFVGVRIIENTLFVPNSDPHEISSMNRGDRTGGKAREKIYYISIKMGCSVTLYSATNVQRDPRTKTGRFSKWTVGESNGPWISDSYSGRYLTRRFTCIICTFLDRIWISDTALPIAFNWIYIFVFERLAH